MPPPGEHSFFDELARGVAEPAGAAYAEAGAVIERTLRNSATARRNLEDFTVGLLIGLQKSNLRLDADTQGKIAELLATSMMGMTFPLAIVDRIPPFAEGFAQGFRGGATSLADLARGLISGEVAAQVQEVIRLLQIPNRERFIALGEETGRNAANQLAAALTQPDWEAAVVRAVGQIWGEEVFESVLSGGTSRLLKPLRQRATSLVHRARAPRHRRGRIDDRGLEARPTQAQRALPDKRPADVEGPTRDPQPSDRTTRATDPDARETPEVGATPDRRRREPSPDAEVPAPRRSGPALVHRKLSKSDEGRAVVKTSEPDFTDVDGAPAADHPKHRAFVKAFTTLMKTYEAALESVWDSALRDALQSQPMQERHERWIRNRERILELMARYPMVDELSETTTELWKKGLVELPAKPAHERLAAELGPRGYDELVAEVNAIVKAAKADGSALYNATRSRAIQMMPTQEVLTLIGVVNSLSVLDRGRVVAWGVDDILAGRPPRVRGTQNTAIRYRAINLDHAARQSDNPWRSVDFGNLSATFAKDNQVTLERTRNLGGVVTDDPIVQWLHSLRSQGARVSPEFSDPTMYDVSAQPDGTPDWDAEWEDLFPSVTGKAAD